MPKRTTAVERAVQRVLSDDERDDDAQRMQQLGHAVDELYSAAEKIINLPYGMQPAPKVIRVSKPIDLGDYVEDYRGWQIVFDLTVGLDYFEAMASMGEIANDEPIEMVRKLREWLERSAVAWNFVDRDGMPIPQPGEGGCAFVRQELLTPLARAYVDATRPPKA